MSHYNFIIVDNETDKDTLTVATIKNAPIQQGKLQTVLTFEVGPKKISVSEADAKDLADFITQTLARK